MKNRSNLKNQFNFLKIVFFARMSLFLVAENILRHCISEKVSCQVLAGGGRCMVVVVNVSGSRTTFYRCRGRTRSVLFSLNIRKQFLFSFIKFSENNRVF